MADIAPFSAYRYDAAKVGGLERVITQPYDKITPAMLERYLSLSPYNLARVIKTADYAAAARCLDDWRKDGALVRDPRPALYPYVQSYTLPGSGPGTGEKRTRRALIASLKLEEYSAGVVYRHELTLAGPKQDRLALMRATRAHCELLFLLHDDPGGKIAKLLDEMTSAPPAGGLRDDFGDQHSLWRVDQADAVAEFQRLLASQRLLMADGHHRYETALAFRQEVPSADRVLVALVSIDAPGLTILPTHRLLVRAAGFDCQRLLADLARDFEIRETSVEEGRAALATHTLGACFAGHPGFYVLRAKSPMPLDVDLLHKRILGQGLGVTEEMVRQEKCLEYVREFEKGIECVRNGAPVCFFLHPVSVAQVRDISYAGGVMPQKSTDFYPKMLSGLVIQTLA